MLLFDLKEVVEVTGFEPAASSSRTKRCPNEAEPHLEIKLPTLFRDSFISISQKSLSVNTFLKFSLNFLEQLCHQTAQLCAAALGSLVRHLSARERLHKHARRHIGDHGNTDERQTAVRGWQ